MSVLRLRRALPGPRATLAAAGVLAAAHAAPAITSIGPLRRRLLPNLAGVGDPGHVALTFDDGPDPRSTPAFLAALREYEVTATFFLLGRMLVEAPDVGRELVDAGHEIAVHGWEHRCMLLRGPAATYDDLARAVETIVDVTGTLPRWYRPPYGVLSSSALRAARRLGLTPVLWTNWGRDWTRAATPASVLATVTRDLDGGATVLLHDSDCTSAPESWRNTLGALPPLLEEVREQGLAVGPLRDHALPRSAATA
ncbi:polysaccharide deacetylase family protein [Actinoallomurus soli]|uniref:polysaccharide deacetylase family protein n=1 Tax=Actinoallomurus soli TaxID=2952535 RepID=UPI0020926B22|nr:polysaccharide deacetylase family protein [Actinoallomurus soli]MCO5970235.1 polysaccharide deacetylase family protein [Actinoallomurus soli]